MSQLTIRLAAAFAAATALLLAGCTGDDPIVLPGPDPTTAPVFATDEDALAAAEVAFGEYLRASAEISVPDGLEPDTVRPFVTEDYFEEVLASFEKYRAENRFTEGVPNVTEATLQQYQDPMTGPAQVVVYLCLDISEARVVDDVGNDITPADRVDRVPLEVNFVTNQRTETLLVDSSEPWTGEDFCGS